MPRDSELKSSIVHLRQVMEEITKHNTVVYYYFFIKQQRKATTLSPCAVIMQFMQCKEQPKS